MRKLILTATIIAATATGIYAQPRAAGLRLGTTGIEADYQHEFSRDRFAEGNLGLDYGINADNVPGIKATAVYNFVWARPAWTDKGSWALYAGPGVSLGYVSDDVHFKAGNEVIHYPDSGFMIGVCGQVGLEYTFWFPLQLSIDLRPCVGMHVNGGYRYTEPATNVQIKYDPRVGFYDNGLLGFAPSISVRYRF